MKQENASKILLFNNKKTNKQTEIQQKKQNKIFGFLFFNVY